VHHPIENRRGVVVASLLMFRLRGSPSMSGVVSMGIFVHFFFLE
jgi:hypothetical protein